MIELLFTLATVALVYALAHHHDRVTIKVRAQRKDRRL